MKICRNGSRSKTPFTERPATYASKSPGPNASKMVPTIIGEDLTIRGNVISKGEIQDQGCNDDAEQVMVDGGKHKDHVGRLSVPLKSLSWLTWRNPPPISHLSIPWAEQ